jgi:hypothetical protein
MNTGLDPHHQSESNTTITYSSLQQSQTTPSLLFQDFSMLRSDFIAYQRTRTVEKKRLVDAGESISVLARAIDIIDRIVGTTTTTSSGLAPLETTQHPDKTANVLIGARGPERQQHYEWHGAPLEYYIIAATIVRQRLSMFALDYNTQTNSSNGPVVVVMMYDID